ncbi:MAG TPA: hypothetical protein EYN06_00930 [Myxococcales bacterium]|nr:hypothetical protein [Myxococcales bacterium]HIN85013.1 hypothetical protein [Myxococcales bacterium]
MQVLLDSVPDSIRPRVSRDAPEQLRMMIARAMVPMGPEDLFTALAYLASNEEGALKETALKSLADIPNAVIQGVIEETRKSDLLDFAIHEYVKEESIVTSIILNTFASDECIEWAARQVSSTLVELIATNQERITRHPSLVEAIYYNPESPMAVVSRVFETAVRAGLELNHIPGYREIYLSIFGTSPTVKPGEIPIEENIEETVTTELLDENDYVNALRDVVTAEESGEGEEEEEETQRENLYAKIGRMNVPQRVRMALVGSATARAILIKDSKQVVCMAVLSNPQLSEKEIAKFSKNKAIPEVIIHSICRNREWTKSPQIQLSLITHPKTPPASINRWIRSMGYKILKDLSKSREVSGYVSRLAKNVLAQKERKK